MRSPRSVISKCFLECVESATRAKDGHIVHMYQDDGDFDAVLVVQIRCGADETERVGKYGVELVVPGFAGLFEAVERFDEVPDASGSVVVSGRLAHVNVFLEA